MAWVAKREYQVTLCQPDLQDLFLLFFLFLLFEMIKIFSLQFFSDKLHRFILQCFEMRKKLLLRFDEAIQPRLAKLIGSIPIELQSLGSFESGITERHKFLRKGIQTLSWLPVDYEVSRR